MKKLRLCAMILLSLSCLIGTAACANNPSLKMEDHPAQQIPVDGEIDTQDEKIPDEKPRDDKTLKTDDRPDDGDKPGEEQKEKDEKDKHHRRHRPKTLPGNLDDDLRKRIPVEPVPIPTPVPPPRPKF